MRATPPAGAGGEARRPAGAYPDLDELIGRIADLRPLPSCATRILELTEGDRFSADDLARAIESDQAVTARLLRLANSAYYGFPRRISTARDAVVLLGFRAVRSATLSACVISTMAGSSILDQRAFWHFSAAVGTLAEVSAGALRTHQHEAFTAGVMHNLGRLAMDQHVPHLLRDSLEYAARQRVSIHEAQRALFGFSDAGLGGALALHWNFPAPLVEAVTDHVERVETLDESDGLAAHISQARTVARALGLPDGLERGRRASMPAGWTTAPISVALRQSGGVDAALQRADVFLQSART